MYLLVVCRQNEHLLGMASLQFPFALYGAPKSELTYKTVTGETQKAEFGTTDAGDALVVSRVDAFKPLIGAVIRVEDQSGNLRTYHMPAAGTEPFDSGCKP